MQSTHKPIQPINGLIILAVYKSRQRGVYVTERTQYMDEYFWHCTEQFPHLFFFLKGNKYEIIVVDWGNHLKNSEVAWKIAIDYIRKRGIAE